MAFAAGPSGRQDDEAMKISLANNPRRGPGQAEMRESPLWLMVGFWASIVIGVAVVVRRLIAIAHPSPTGPPQMVALDAVFASHAALTLAHIVPAMAFVLLTPFVFLRRTGAAWAERLLFPLGAVVGVTAYAMSTYSATSAQTHLEPRQFFGIAFWIGFSITIAVELWLHSSDVNLKQKGWPRIRGLGCEPMRATEDHEYEDQPTAGSTAGDSRYV